MKLELNLFRQHLLETFFCDNPSYLKSTQNIFFFSPSNFFFFLQKIFKMYLFSVDNSRKIQVF